MRLERFVIGFPSEPNMCPSPNTQTNQTEVWNMPTAEVNAAGAVSGPHHTGVCGAVGGTEAFREKREASALLNKGQGLDWFGGGRGDWWSEEARGMVVNGVEGELISGGVLD